MVTRNETSLVAIIMGSASDWEMIKNASDVLEEPDIPFEATLAIGAAGAKNCSA